MKVRELRDQLDQLDPELLVAVYSEDEELDLDLEPVCIFAPIGVEQRSAYMERLCNGVIWPKFGAGRNPFAFLKVTART